MSGAAGDGRSRSSAVELRGGANAVGAGPSRQDRAARRLAGLTLVVVVAATVVLWREAGRARRVDGRAIELQRIVGGLGMGGERNLARCAAAFDPRVRGACSVCGTALPGGAVYCPAHAFTILRLRAVDRAVNRAVAGEATEGAIDRAVGSEADEAPAEAGCGSADHR